MVNLLLASIFLLLPAVFCYSEDSYLPTSNNEDEPDYFYVATRNDKSGNKSLRSTLEKNTIRYGRSDLPPLLDRYTDDNQVDSDDYRDSGFVRYDRDNSNFVRFGRAPSDFLRFGRGNSNFMRFGRGGSNFVRFGRGDKDFLRYGRDGSSFVRFGRDPIDSKPIRSSQSFLRFGRVPTENEENSISRNKRNAPYKKHASSFLRFGKNDGPIKYGLEDEVSEEASQTSNRQSENPVFLGKLNKLHRTPLVQLLTALDCKMEQDKCLRLG